MFNPRKSDQFPGSPGALGIILAALIALSFITSLFASGAAPKVAIGGVILFALWWLYNKFAPSKKRDETNKYQKALRQQKKTKSEPAAASRSRDKGKVIYLNEVKRK